MFVTQRQGQKHFISACVVYQSATTLPPRTVVRRSGSCHQEPSLDLKTVTFSTLFDAKHPLLYTSPLRQMHERALFPHQIQNMLTTPQDTSNLW